MRIQIEIRGNLVKIEDDQDRFTTLEIIHIIKESISELNETIK